jgi:hypothetical protein
LPTALSPYLPTTTSVFLFGTVPATAQDVKLTADGKVPGQPFQNLQNQIDELEAQLDAIQLLRRA